MGSLTLDKWPGLVINKLIQDLGDGDRRTADGLEVLRSRRTADGFQEAEDGPAPGRVCGLCGNPIGEDEVAYLEGDRAYHVYREDCHPGGISGSLAVP